MTQITDATRESRLMCLWVMWHLPAFVLPPLPMIHFPRVSFLERGAPFLTPCQSAETWEVGHLSLIMRDLTFLNPTNAWQADRIEKDRQQMRTAPFTFLL